MARRSALLFVLLCAALGWPRAAFAIDFKINGEPLRLDLTESLFLAAHLDNGNGHLNPLTHTCLQGTSGNLPGGDCTDDNYGELLNRLNAQLAWRRFLFAIRFDSGAWVNPPPQALLATQKYAADRYLDPGVVQKRGPLPIGATAFYLEKISASYAGRDVEVTLGDFYVNLGRGLVLSIRKVDELGVDTTLTGGKLIVHKGDFSATAVAGFTNVQNIDQTRAQWIADPNDLVAAGNIGYRILKKALLAANVMWGRAACPSGQTCADHPIDTSYYLRPGVMLDAPRLTKWLGLYAEYARRQDTIGIAPTGNAFYGAANVYLGRVGLLFETKWYDNFQPWHAANDPFGNLVYQVPPTLERITIQLNNNTDILAARARANLRVNDRLNLYVSGEVGRSYPSINFSTKPPTPLITDILLDLYAGAEIRWNQGRSYFFPLIELRNEHQNTNLAGGVPPDTEERLIALEWDGAQHLGHRLSLETQGVVWLRQKELGGLATGDQPGYWCSRSSDPNRIRWCEGNVYVSLKWASKLSASLGYEFTTSEQEVHNTHDFVNGAFQWNITSATSIGLFVGGNRPGLKCISGVCRDFPAFQGARLELVLRL